MKHILLAAGLFCLAACGAESIDSAASETPETVKGDVSDMVEESSVDLHDSAQSTQLAKAAELGLKPYGTDDVWPDELSDILLPAPWDSVKNTAGTNVSLSDIMGEQGAVIVFSRSAEWCPYCQKQMLELEEAKALLAERGLSLSVMTYDSPETLAAFAEKNSLTYNFLSDANSSTIEAWGLLNEGVPKDTKYYGVPHPGFAMIEPDGDIKGLIVDEDYKSRPTTEELVQEAIGFLVAG